MENDVSLDNSNKMVLDVAYEINTTWLDGGPTPCRVLAQNQRYMSTNKAKA
jgi:hypothetical protein